MAIPASSLADDTVVARFSMACLPSGVCFVFHATAAAALALAKEAFC